MIITHNGKLVGQISLNRTKRTYKRRVTRPAYKGLWLSEFNKRIRNKNVWFSHVVFAWVLIGFLILAITLYIESQKGPVSPVPDDYIIKNGFSKVMRQIDVQVYAKEVEVPIGEEVDVWVGKYVDEYFTDPGRRSEMRMIMHCLLNKETRHGVDNNFGDGGRAGGPLQFHQPTWNGYRKIMIDRGLITEIGDRMDLKQAIETTVWAIKDGRAKAWGPLLRDYNGSDKSTCPFPSWY